MKPNYIAINGVGGSLNSGVYTVLPRDMGGGIGKGKAKANFDFQRGVYSQNSNHPSTKLPESDIIST